MQPGHLHETESARVITWRRIVLACGIVVAPAPAWAYVDPGIVGLLYQAVYAVFFGGLMAWMLKPWRYVTKFFTRDKPSDDREKLP